MFKIKLLTTALFFIFSLGVIYSQLSHNPSTVLFQHISLKEGLSQSTVYDIKQDQLGYIWIATTDGLNRYDGYKFVVYRHDENDESSLPSNSITSLLPENDGDMWIGTDGGLAKYNHKLNSFKTFNTNDKAPRLRVFSLQKWNDEKLYLITNAGLFSFSEKGGFEKRNFPAVSFGVTALLKIDTKMLIGADKVFIIIAQKQIATRLQTVISTVCEFKPCCPKTWKKREYGLELKAVVYFCLIYLIIL